MSFVCPIHDRYVPDGKRCPYCIEPEAPPDTLRAGLRTVIVRKIKPDDGASIWRAAVLQYVEKAQERQIRRLEDTFTDCALASVGKL